MQISYKTLLKKMNHHIQAASTEQSEGKIREHIRAVKTLCEIILDEEVQATTAAYSPQPGISAPVRTGAPKTTTLSEKRLETDDGANGESIFDF